LSSPYPIPDPVPGLTHAYWVVTGALLAGAYPGAPDADDARRRVEALFATGVRLCVNLMEATEVDRYGCPFRPYEPELSALAAAAGREVGFERMPVRDLDVPTPAEMVRILDVVDGAIHVGRPVYVHCLGGIGRTGTVVGCWLVRHSAADGEAALQRIERLRRNTCTAGHRSPETATQLQFVRDWKAGA
jgi:hypothetical protein